MRLWFMHPIIFYPLVAALVALIVGVSLQPQSWPRPPSPVAGEVIDGSIVLRGAAFDAPATGPDQRITVVRDFFGRAQVLRIAQPESEAPLSPPFTGTDILLTPATAHTIDSRPVRVEVRYHPLPVNAAATLAVSLQGVAPATWVSLPAPPLQGVLTFELPPQGSVRSVGLRATSDAHDQPYGLEIVSVRLTPYTPAPAPPPVAAAEPALAPGN